MLKHKIKLGKSQKHNSGKTWEVPAYLPVETVKFDASDVKNQKLYVVFDFIKYELRFDINDNKLGSLLFYIGMVFHKLHYTEELDKALDEFRAIKKENIFDVVTDKFNETQDVKLNLEYAERLADFMRKLNKLLYQMPLHFSYSHKGYSFEKLNFDIDKTVEHIKQSKWGADLFTGSKNKSITPSQWDRVKKLRKEKEIYEDRVKKLTDFSLEHAKKRLKDIKNELHCIYYVE